MGLTRCYKMTVFLHLLFYGRFTIFQNGGRLLETFRRYGRFSIFKMAASAILDFQNLEILTSSVVRRPNLHHCAKFCEDRSTVPDIWPNCNFQDGGRPPSWIFKSWKFRRSVSEGQYASSCQILRRSVKPFQRYVRLSIFKMAAVRHLGFLEVGNFDFRYHLEAELRF